MKKIHPPGKQERGLSLAELLVVLAITAAIIAITFPLFSIARKKAAEVTCRQNLKTLGVASLIYANDHQGEFPMAKDWSQPTERRYWWRMLQPILYPEATSSDIMGVVYRCPASPMYTKYGKENSYGSWMRTSYSQAVHKNLPGYILKSQDLTAPAKTVYLIEAANAGDLKIVNEGMFNRWVVTPKVSKWHDGGINVLFADGHLAFVREPLEWERVNPAVIEAGDL